MLTPQQPRSSIRVQRFSSSAPPFSLVALLSLSFATLPCALCLKACDGVYLEFCAFHSRPFISPLAFRTWKLENFKNTALSYLLDKLLPESAGRQNETPKGGNSSRHFSKMLPLVFRICVQKEASGVADPALISKQIQLSRGIMSCCISNPNCNEREDLYPKWLWLLDLYSN